MAGKQVEIAPGVFIRLEPADPDVAAAEAQKEYYQIPDPDDPEFTSPVDLEEFSLPWLRYRELEFDDA